MDYTGNLPCDIADVVELLGIRVVRNTGTQLHCKCPFCDDRKAHLNINLGKNVFRCNRCGKGGGVLHLYAEANGISLNAAYEELCNIYRHGEHRPERSIQKKVIKQKAQKPQLDLAPASVRDNTYSNLLSMLSLGTAHREAMLNRGVSGEDIIKLGYKTTPAVRAPKIVTELLERGCELGGVPGFYIDEETGKWKMDIRGSGIMIPDRNSKGQIEAIVYEVTQKSKGVFSRVFK